MKAVGRPTVVRAYGSFGWKMDAPFSKWVPGITVSRFPDKYSFIVTYTIKIYEFYPSRPFRCWFGYLLAAVFRIKGAFVGLPRTDRPEVVGLRRDGRGRRDGRFVRRAGEAAELFRERGCGDVFPLHLHICPLFDGAARRTTRESPFHPPEPATHAGHRLRPAQCDGGAGEP